MQVGRCLNIKVHQAQLQHSAQGIAMHTTRGVCLKASPGKARPPFSLPKRNPRTSPFAHHDHHSFISRIPSLVQVDCYPLDKKRMLKMQETSHEAHVSLAVLAWLAVDQTTPGRGRAAGIGAWWRAAGTP